MFLKLIKLKKKNISSPASRFSYFFYTSWLNQLKIKKLSMKIKWKAGRNSKGTVVSRSKTSQLRKYKNFQINYYLRLKSFGVISSFQFIPFFNKVLSLVYFVNGSISYFLTSERQSVFSFFVSKNNFISRFKFKFYYFMIFQVKKLSKVSFIECTPGSYSKYSRSPGSLSKIINLDRANHISIIILPSGVKRVFSFYSFVYLGKLALSSNKFFSNNKAGYWRSFGKNSIVRGVAMNPVDHPHGGRTKSIKYPRTPWGKTTKFK